MYTGNQEYRQVLNLKTPEGVNFSLPLAGVFTRLLAVIIDQAVITVGIIMISSIAAIVGAFSADIAIAFIILMQFLIATSYGILIEWYWNGQTVGKRILKIQVIDESGMHITFAQIAIRNLLRIIDLLPAFYCIGAIFFICSRRNKRLGDIAANTVVVYIAQPELPDFDQIAPEKFNSLRSRMHLVARLRNKVNNKVAHLALNALLRRNAFTPEARIQVFAELADYFNSLTPVTTEDTQNISDEQLIRNIVEILFRTDTQNQKVIK